MFGKRPDGFCSVKGTKTVCILEMVGVAFDQFPNGLWIAYAVGKPLHQGWEPDLPLDDHVENELIKVRAIVSRIPLLGANNTVFGGLARACLGVVLAPYECLRPALQTGLLHRVAPQVPK